MKVKVFLFHRVSPEPDLLWDPIPPDKFDSIIKLIKKNFEVIRVEDFALNKLNYTNSKPLAAVVFDDGYKDFLKYALPILKKHECLSSMYIVTNCVDQQIPPWTYILDFHFIHSKKLKIQLNQGYLPSHLQVTKFKDDNSRIRFAKQFKPFLKTISNSKRVELFNEVINSLDDVRLPEKLMMNWDDLKQIQSEGVVIGSHTVSHPLLSMLENEAELIDELKNSREIIAQKLGKFPTTVSYPIGSYNEKVKQTALECGYNIGLAVNQTTYNSKIHDLFEIPRIELYNESLLKSRLRMLGIISKINKFINK